MDELFDSLRPARPSNKTDQERVDAVLSHPLFMTSQDMALEYAEQNEETVSAIQSLVFDGTPQEMAENFKLQGNACFLEGKMKYKHAIKYYTQGIECKADDNELNSVLHSNRAAVNLELSNFRSVLYDCAQAIKLNPKNVKAYYRSVKALLALDRIDECIDSCKHGLLIDPTNPHFARDMKKAKERGEQLAELRRLQDIKAAAKQSEEQALNQALASRKYHMKNVAEDPDDDETGVAPQHPDASPYRIELLPSGELSFPVMFLYPEFSQTDVISSFKESDTFYSHFEIMFAQPAPWDPQHHYHPQALDFYFESQPEKYAKENKELVSILKSVQAAGAPSQDAAHRYVCCTLADVLAHPKHTIVNGLVRIIILSRQSSEFSLNYRKEHRRLNK
ncbi:hypothetical protein HDV03_002646 [Kappamyces sp. JEL0829]|nr:hypothetical protein HDV03_002646 [Kappamyces sp. JEL0829]